MKKRATEKIKFSVARKYVGGDYQTQAGHLHTASVALCLLVNSFTRLLVNSSTRQLVNSKKSVHHPKHPQRNFVTKSTFHTIHRKVTIGKVFHLSESFISTTNFEVVL